MWRPFRRKYWVVLGWRFGTIVCSRFDPTGALMGEGTLVAGPFATATEAMSAADSLELRIRWKS
jgi:hypothetical protein